MQIAVGDVAIDIGIEAAIDRLQSFTQAGDIGIERAGRHGNVERRRARMQAVDEFAFLAKGPETPGLIQRRGDDAAREIMLFP